MMKHVLLTVIVGGALAALIYKQLPPGWTVLQTIGLCLSVLGFILWTLARFQLGASFSVTAQARQLVSRGIYSRIRNPIYVFGSFVIAGVILLLGHPVALLVFVAIIPMQI